MSVSANRVADAGVALSAGCVATGLTIGQVNQYLQAAAFVVAIISGSCAAYYYLTRAKRKGEWPN